MTQLSPEVQVCYNEVQKTPENQRQSTFERACQKIKDKTQIALLATMLGLWLSQTPNTAQAWEPQKVEAQANSVANNPEYKKLLSTLGVEFPKLVEQWKKEVSPENQAKFEKWMWRMKERLGEWTLSLDAVSMFEKMVDKNWSFYTNFYNYVAKFEPFSKQLTAQRMANIAETRARIEANRIEIAKNKETIQQLDKNIALLESLGKAWKK